MASFSSFDGIDGVGKTTQIQQFRVWLQELGHDVVVCRDPGSTELGEKIRDLLLSRSTMAMALPAEMLLYMAARAQLVDEVIGRRCRRAHGWLPIGFSWRTWLTKGTRAAWAASRYGPLVRSPPTVSIRSSRFCWTWIR